MEPFTESQVLIPKFLSQICQTDGQPASVRCDGRLHADRRSLDVASLGDDDVGFRGFGVHSHVTRAMLRVRALRPCHRRESPRAVDIAGLGGCLERSGSGEVGFQVLG